MHEIAEFVDFLEDLFLQHRKRAVALRWTIRTGRTTITVTPAKGEHLMFLLGDDQQVLATIQPRDAKGFPANIDGLPVWTSSDVAVATVETVDPSGMTALIKGIAPGSCQVNVTCDADLGAGVTTIGGVVDIQVEPGVAVTLGVVMGVPEQQ
jgi:hypothetical protein